MKFLKYVGMLFALCTLFSTLTFGNTSELEEKYYNELKKLDKEQLGNLIVAYYVGDHEDLGLVLASIVWKESSFGKHLINSADGKYGSFGLAQVLLQTAMKRTNAKSKKAREELRLRLITDPKFNLQMAMKELLYWKHQYQVKKKSAFWLTHMVASYNNGWKGYEGAGKRYADDAKVRRRALVRFFKDKNNLKKSHVLEPYLLEIRELILKDQ